MLKTYNYVNGTVRIIIDEVAMDNDMKIHTCKGISKPKDVSRCELPTSLGLEVSLHRGGRICYGLLQASIKPKDIVDAIEISVDYTKKNTIRFCDSILTNDNYVYKGLPEQYLGAVMDGAIMAINEKEIFPIYGISFDHAANCEVGSSQMFFKMISESIIELISMTTSSNINDSVLKPYLGFLEGKFGLKC